MTQMLSTNNAAGRTPCWRFEYFCTGDIVGIFIITYFLQDGLDDALALEGTPSLRNVCVCVYIIYIIVGLGDSGCVARWREGYIDAAFWRDRLILKFEAPRRDVMPHYAL